MNMFAVIYLKGSLAAAMFLWPGATLQDCEKINAQYASGLSATPGVVSGQVRIDDIRLACEWHDKNPVTD